MSRKSCILEVGSSSGLLLKNLEKIGFKLDNMYALDHSSNAIKNCQSIGIKNAILADAHETNLPKRMFDLIIASDIVEHLKCDKQAVEHWHDLLKKNGRLIIIVPAFSFLWSKHDIHLHHIKRFNKQSLKRLVTDSGFSIVEMGFWNVLLFFPILFYRTVDNIFQALKRKENISKPHTDLSATPNWLNTFLIKLLSFENKWNRKVKFPFGVSLFVLAKSK